MDYFYDPTGLKTKVTDALDHSTEYFFPPPADLRHHTRHVLTRTLDAVGKELRYPPAADLRYNYAKNRVTKTGGTGPSSTASAPNNDPNRGSFPGDAAATKFTLACGTVPRC